MDENQKFELNISEIFKRLIKYMLEGFAVGIAARYIPPEKLDNKDIYMIAFSAAFMFALLDMYAPSISISARQGAGMALGAAAVGGIKTY